MRWLLDTNVVSEMVKPRPDSNVESWLRHTSTLDLSLCVLTLGEIDRGIQLMPDGQRRVQLTQWLSTDLPRQFLGRLIPIDDAVAIAWGRLSAASTKSGRPLPVIDGLLLAAADVHGLTFVTRNVSDCADRGVPIFNPWSQMHH